MGGWGGGGGELSLVGFRPLARPRAAPAGKAAARAEIPHKDPVIGGPGHAAAGAASRGDTGGGPGPRAAQVEGSRRADASAARGGAGRGGTWKYLRMR